MQMTIAERLRPFCHVPGTSLVLPGAGLQVQVFPCLIRINDLKHSKPHVLELTLDLQGPVQEFTIFSDLEKGCITVSGKTASGWLRYHLVSALQSEGVRLVVEKAPINGVLIGKDHQHYLLHAKEWLDLFEQHTSFEPFQVPSCDRLSLGNHKAQDWELIKRRFDLTELLPLVHRLGQLVPVIEAPQLDAGTLFLLEECRQSFVKARPEEGEDIWLHFLKGCFSKMLVPQLEDWDHQGLVKKGNMIIPQDVSPLVILSEGASLIRRLFVQQEQNQIAILPYLLPSLHCGRLLNVSLEDGGRLSLEWTKKTIRRLMLHAGKDQECVLKFRSGVRSYRLCEQGKLKGEKTDVNTPLFFKKNCYYLFDNFQ